MTVPRPSATQLIGFKRHLRAEVVHGDATYLFSERGVTALKGTCMESLAPLLDGTRDLPTLLGDLPDAVSPQQVGSLIVRLDQAGLLTLRTPSAAPLDERSIAYWEAGGIDAAGSPTGGRRVDVFTVGGVDAGLGIAELRAAGLDAVASEASVCAADAALSVVLCDDYLAPRLAEIDAAHRAAGRQWLLAKPVGAQVWIGPVFAGEGHACWHCMASRLWGHRQAEAHVQATLGRQGPATRPVAAVPPLVAMAKNLIALEVCKWLAGYRYPGQQSIWTFDSFDLAGRHHELRARPQCASCGDATLMHDQTLRPVVLTSRTKATGCGQRALPPDEVMATYRHLISPVTGIVKEIRRDTTGPALFNSFLAGTNLAVSAQSFDGLRSELRSQNGGKGITAEHAEVSALCEALERRSGCFHGDEPRIRGSFAALGERAVHPDTVQLFDRRQYPDRQRWNGAHSSFQFVCDPFDDDAVMDWTPVWSLTGRCQRLLPTAMLYFGAPVESAGLCVRADSNGNAAGSSLEDAVLHGMLELVERDAVALWWYNRTRAPQVDLAAFADPWLDEVRTAHAELHREIWVLDLTSDVGVPTMAALSRRTDKSGEDIMFGFGTHLDPRVALRRALTELNQLMPAVLAATAGGGYQCEDPEAVSWWRSATVANQPYLLPDPALAPRTLADFDYRPCADLHADITSVQTALESLDMEVLVLDQTRPDIGLPVAKVIVPGLRGFWARLAPGRLFDVPVRMGRLDRPTAYEDLNPIPLFV